MNPRSRVVQEGGLGDLERAAKTHVSATDRLRKEILFASLAGSSLRAIALVVDMSPETVRAIITTTNAKRERVIARLAVPSASLSEGDVRRNKAHRRRLAREWRIPVQESDD